MHFLKDQEALRLEAIVQEAYDCDRFGVMGIADSDYLSLNPIDAAIVIFTQLYKSQRKIPEIDEFVDKYMGIFKHPECYEYKKEVVEEYINTLEELAKKYDLI